MEKDHSPDIEFSLVDVILPLAEMWKILIVLPALVAGVVYVALQFYPAELTYNGAVHLPEERVRTLFAEETLTQILATVTANDVEVPTARDLVTRLQIVSNKEDETRLSLILPRRAASPELLGAVMGLLRPEADKFLEHQKNQAADDMLLSQRTVTNLKASAVELNAALETAQQANPVDVNTVSGLTQTLMGVANALWAGQNVLLANQVRVNELAIVNVFEPFRPESKSSLIVALSGGGVLFLILVYIYVRQEILFALSHDNGKQKVAKIVQALKIFRPGKPTRP